MGPAAGGFINELALGMQQYLTLQQIADTTHVYPTVALSVQQAAGKFSLRRARASGFLQVLRKLGS